MFRVINKQRGFESWRPPVWKFFIHFAGVGCIILAFWAALKYACGGLLPFHKCFSCSVPTFIGIFNIWFWTPRDLIKLDAKAIIIAGAAPMCMLQFASYVYLAVCALLLHVNHCAVLVLFPITRHCCNLMYSKVAAISNTTDILPILFTVNSCFERLHAMNALSMTDINPVYVAITMDWAFTIRSLFIIILPHRYQEAPWREKLSILSSYLLCNGQVIKLDNTKIEKPESASHTRRRSEHTFFYVSECVTEILTPFTYLMYYYVISGFNLAQGIAGFDDSETLGRGTIDGDKLLEAALIFSGIDFAIFCVSLFIVNRHFPKFNPFGTLTAYIEGLGGLYTISFIMPILLLVGYDFIGTNTNYKFEIQYQD